MAKPLLYGVIAIFTIALLAAGYLFVLPKEPASGPAQAVLPQPPPPSRALPQEVPSAEQEPTESTEPAAQEPLQPPSSAPSPQPAPPPSSEPPPTSEEPAPAPPQTREPRTYTVLITSSGFEQKIITIVAGDSVKWINKDTRLHWPASDPHPTHTLYPAFDALGDLAPDESYTFRFRAVGNYGYHDHSGALTETEEIFTGLVKVIAK